MSCIVSRGTLFGWLLLIGAANGLMRSFGISMIVWSACGVGLLLFNRKADPAPLSRADLVLAPVGWMGWLVMTGLGIHLLRIGAICAVVEGEPGC